MFALAIDLSRNLLIIIIKVNCDQPEEAQESSCCSSVRYEKDESGNYVRKWVMKLLKVKMRIESGLHRISYIQREITYRY